MHVYFYLCVTPVAALAVLLGLYLLVRRIMDNATISVTKTSKPLSKCPRVACGSGSKGKAHAPVPATDDGGADDDDTDKSLYERLGGVFAIAMVVDRFSNQLITNPKVGRNSCNAFLRDWSRNKQNRLPGLKWMRTLWVCDVAGGPYKFRRSKSEDDGLASIYGNGARLDLTQPHCPIQISGAEFDEVAKELSKTLDFYKIPAREKREVLAAFAAHKDEVTACFYSKKIV